MELLRGAGRVEIAVDDFAKRGAALLAEAAKDWRGERALGDGGQLVQAFEALFGAGMLETLVDVCMTCARNFVVSGPLKPCHTFAAIDDVGHHASTV